MVLCSQPTPCKSCRSCTQTAAARTIITSPPRSHIEWFPRTKAEYTSGWHTESQLNMEAKAVMDDETALATFNELRHLDRRFKVESLPLRTRCEELRTVRATVPFRLLDLPAEVRLSIYEYALQNNGVHRLRNFVTPALARTSRQLRVESLPVWFAISTFVAEVKSTFLGISVCATHGSRAEYISKQDTRYRRLGNLNLSGAVTRLLATCPPSLIRLRNIDFCMLSADVKQDWQQSDRFAMLSVRDGRPVRITTHVGGGKNLEYSKHVNHVFDHGRRYLQQLVTDPGYQGLYIIQLKDIAAAFRAEAPPPPRPDPSIQPQPITASLPPVGQNLKPEQQNAVGASDALRKPQKPRRFTSPRPAEDSIDDFDLPRAEEYFLTC